MEEREVKQQEESDTRLREEMQAMERQFQELRSGPPGDPAFNAMVPGYPGDWAEAQEVKETMLIGIAGSRRGTGVTHTAIVLANFIKERKEGCRIALMEGNRSGDFERIEASYEAVRDGNYFSYGGIDYYPEVDQTRLDLSLQKEYDYLLLDLGLYSDCDRESFHTCDRQLIITGGKAWEVGSVSEIFAAAGKGAVGRYHFCFNFVPESLIRVVKGGMGELQTAFLAYTEDPFEARGLLLREGDIFYGDPSLEGGDRKESRFFQKEEVRERI